MAEGGGDETCGKFLTGSPSPFGGVGRVFGLTNGHPMLPVLP